MAFCDVDDNNIAKAKAKLSADYPEIKVNAIQAFFDYRKMLEEIPNQIDAVFVCMPDHHHATAAMRAMKPGKSVYVEKPLAHSIEECRALAAAAKQVQRDHADGQPGPQPRRHPRAVRVPVGRGHRQRAGDPSLGPHGPRRHGRAAARQGRARRLALGRVDRPGRVSAIIMPTCTPAAGGAGGSSATARWAIGAATTWTAPSGRLDLGHPTSIEALEQAGGSDERYPLVNVIRWNFPARGNQPPVKVHWYDGYHGLGSTIPKELGEEVLLAEQNRPPIVIELEKKYNRKFGDGGSIFIGDKGILSTRQLLRKPADRPGREHQKFPRAGQEASAAQGHPPAGFHHGPEGRQEVVLRLRVHRAAERNGALGLPGGTRRPGPEGRVGRRRHAVQEPPRAQQPRQTPVPQRLGAVGRMLNPASPSRFERGTADSGFG